MGCGVLVLGSVVVIGVVAVMAVRWGNTLKNELEDPGTIASVKEASACFGFVRAPI